MSANTQTLGLEGFAWGDLFLPEKLAKLTELFEDHAKSNTPEELWTRWTHYKHCGGEGMAPEAISELLVLVAPHLGTFVGKLFKIEDEVAALQKSAQNLSVIFQFKRDFIKKRVAKRKRAEIDAASSDDKRKLDAQARAVLSAALVAHGSARLDTSATDPWNDELYAADLTVTLLGREELFRKSLAAGGASATDADRALCAVFARMLSTSDGGGALRALTAWDDQSVHDERCAALYSAALEVLDRWCALRMHDSAYDHHWVSIRMPKTLDYQHLVHLRRPDAKLPELFVGPASALRARDGFALTDARPSAREIANDADYCIYCHDRSKDSCSKGFVDKTTGGFKSNPLGISLTGCPLEEKISETNFLKNGGHSVSALAVVMIDNPMCPGTGHRICNDCMKACIYQKQTPVNIPAIETAVLTDVLDLSWGFEIYDLLTRWNPLRVNRPHALAYNGKNVLVVGMGPAGYTLAEHLLNEGFGVVGIDGLKIEPLPDALLNEPVRSWRTFYETLDTRVLLGFGGVSEYGITVRWDKNFLWVVYATLARRKTFKVFGGVRFGGTLTLEDAWNLGFDHVAIAAGAGRPTLIDMPNGLAKGIRQASDFLMALQLSGAYKHDSLANLTVRLPGIVIGGGLTGIDTCTEMRAYYVVQCEKVLARFEALASAHGEKSVWEKLNEEEREILEEATAHGRLIREERAKALTESRAPDFNALIDSWGGVTLAYRRSVVESPAYKLNHEEVEKFLEEGVKFVERVSPKEALVDAHGAVRAIVFDRLNSVDGKLVSTGETVELAARTVCIAAGTAPNATYERELPGTFEMDPKTKGFAPHRVEFQPDGTRTLARDPMGFFTSYDRDGRTVSFYGDNHPTYAGSVVKAMASAKDGYPFVVQTFAKELAELSPADQPARDARWSKLVAQLTDELSATVVRVERLTPTIVEVVVRAPLAARKFKPGQFYRLQNFETLAPKVHGTRLQMEGLALTGASMDEAQGHLSTIVLEMGTSSRLCAALEPGEPVILMGPTGAPTEIPENETVLLAGGGLGNAVLFSIGRALRANGCKVIYFAGYRHPADLYKMEEIEASADQIVWATDIAPSPTPRRPQDRTFVGNIVKAMLAYARGELGERLIEMTDVDRIVAIGSDRMMAAVKLARHQVLQPHLKRGHVAIGSINSPMQCMMKEICAQCLQRQVDPVTGKQTIVFSCFNQDQELDRVDFDFLNARLKQTAMQEKLSDLWLNRLLEQERILKI
ncbi:MAG: FAD-dependent oxidoreductase [Deltaproteobacteria bacterium]|nr:FAD-dependent oxidoreductase [Deltaproteobacteria bacterium]